MKIFPGLLLLLSSLCCCSQAVTKTEERSVADFQKRCGLRSDTLLLLYVINPGECSKIRVPLKRVEEKVEGMGFKKIFLLKDIRQKELGYYLKNELKEEASQYHKAISDNDYFRFFRPDESTGLVGIKNSKVVFNYDIFEAATKIKTNTAKPVLSPTDSVQLDESRAPYSNSLETASIHPDTLYILDNRYNTIRKVDLKTGKELAHLEFTTYYADVYKLFFAQDKWKVAFAMNHHPQLLKTTMNECNTARICIKNKEIYVTVNFLITEFDSLFQYGKDTNEILTYYPFLFRITQGFAVKTIHPISMDFSNYSIANSSFQVSTAGTLFMEFKMKTKGFTKPYLIDHKDDPTLFLGEFKADKKGKYIFHSKLTRPMPDYFLKDKRTYSHSIGSFVDYNDSLGYYFHLLPKIYMLNTAHTIQLNDTTYQSSFGYKNPFNHFCLKYVHPDKSGNADCLYIRNNRYFYTRLDKVSGNVLYEQELPKELSLLPVNAVGSFFYFTKISDASSIVYKYSLTDK